MTTKHSLKASVFHNRMVDAHLASRDRFEDYEVVRQESRRARTPSELLVLAALDDAVLILEYGPRARDYGVYMETRRWVESHAAYPFSFVWICQHFGFDEDAVRVILAEARQVVGSLSSSGSSAQRSPEAERQVEQHQGEADGVHSLTISPAAPTHELGAR